MADFVLDVTTDFQEDSRRRDPDAFSPLLQEYHRRLWSKPLPNGETFDLIPGRIGSALVLRYSSANGTEYILSSDTLATSNRGRLSALYSAMGEEANEHWHRVGGSIGGRLLFPRNRIEGRQTINQRRGTHPRVRDRFDLTLEAIRRHYAGGRSPLETTLTSYASFFALFRSFSDYVEFFLLQDLVDGDRVKFYLPFDDFAGAVLPTSLPEYRDYRSRQLAFVESRNARMASALRDR